MNWFINLKTRPKLFLAFAVIVALLAAVVVSAVLQIRAVEQASSIAQKISAMDGNLNEQRAALLTMLVTPDRTLIEKTRDVVERRKRENDVLLAEVRELYRERGHPESELDEFIGVRTRHNDLRDTQLIPLLLQGKVDEARALQLGTQTELYQKMRDASDKLEASALAEATAEGRRASLVFVIIGVATIAIAVGLVTLLTRLIAGPIDEMAVAAERIANGDLHFTVTAHQRDDEIGVLARSFERMTEYLKSTAAVADQIALGNLRTKVAPRSDRDLLGASFARMIDNLQKLTGELAESVNVLAASAGEISTSTSQLAANASETATAVTETTTTVQELKQTAHLSTQKAKAVSETAQRASQIAQAGRKATEDTSEGMTRIRAQMDSIAGTMVRLSEQSHAIGQIIASVEDLAAQSNLLAVNAAIEAAKAGEQGKGFAVVAQEVKNLAEQSRQATTQVRTILNEIQKATSAAVMATEQGAKAVEAGVLQSRQSGESIVALTGGVSEAAQAATQIAASSQQQLVGVDQVASAIDSIKQASNQNVDSAKMLESAAGKLSELGQTLKLLVGRFQL
jgi:methyl-accepting chemotaxis protein